MSIDATAREWARRVLRLLSDGDKGDITVSSRGSVWTIDNGAVTLAKQADMATASVVYRKTAGAGAPEVQSLATLKTDLGLTGTNSGDQTSIVGISGTKAEFDSACSDGNFLYSGDVPTLASGTYTPTGTGVTNIDTVTPQTFQYLRVGSVVTVSGQVLVDATATGNTTLRLSLPVASAFANVTELAGTGAYTSSTVANNSFARLSGDTTNDEAVMSFNSTVATEVSWLVHFTYQVI